MHTTLTIRNGWTKITGDRAPLDAVLSNWTDHLDEKASMLVNSNGEMLTGLYRRMASALDVNIIDGMQLPSIKKGSMPHWLRDYQFVAVYEAFTKIQGIIKATTGAGKTIIAAGLMDLAKVRWVFMVHKPDVVRAAAKSFRERLKEPVIELNGSKTDWNGRILCATYDQLLNDATASAWLASAEGLIVDECHRAATSAAYKCITSATNAFWRIGMSATPLNRSDKRDIITIGLLGEVIYEIKATELMSEGNITPLDIKWLQCPHQKQGISPRNWGKFYERHVVENDDRNAMLIHATSQCETPALLFVKRKNHAFALTQSLKQLCPGKRIVCVDGDTPKEERDRIVAAVNARAVDYVVATSVFNEGIDAAEFRSAVIGGGGQSWIEGLQRPGRLTRLAPDKELATVYDVADYGVSVLAKHTLERHAAYQSEGFKVEDPFPVVEVPVDDWNAILNCFPTLALAVDVWRLFWPVYRWIALLLLLGLVKTGCFPSE